MRRDVPQVMRQGQITPWFYLLPALIALTIFVVFPTVRTIFVSLRTDDGNHWASEACKHNESDEPCWGVFENYRAALTKNDVTAPNVNALKNTLLWLVVLVPGTILFGLLIAVLTDRVSYGALVKSIIFMPMAISFVGASLIWRFVYHDSPEIGILNAVLDLVGLAPQRWMGKPAPTSTFLLTIVGIWVWTGFTMTVLGAAIRSIPTEHLEAARVDGANELQVFTRIMLPELIPTLTVLVVTMTINTLKMFDIVWVMGARDTDVIATRMVRELTINRNFGQASAIAVVLITLTIPVIYYNVRRFSIEEAER
jgi:alpha-glucoside transport system permease protein